MKIVAIIQVRMSSSRLAGKVLIDINGKPLLMYLIESLNQCSKIDGLIVATSHQTEDDAIDELCSELDVDCFRGALENTAERLFEAAKRHKCEAFVRVNGDSPLMDHRLIDKGCDLMRAGAWDLVTNIRPRTFPRGLSVEVIRTSTLEDALGKMSDAYDREHVAPYLYANAQDYRIHSFVSRADHGHQNFCVDTREDLDRILSLVSAMDRPHWQYGYEELVRLAAGPMNANTA